MQYLATFILSSLAATAFADRTCYSPGLPNFPDQTTWFDLNTLWNIHSASMNQTNMPKENQWIRQYIHQIASDAKVDERFALAIMMRESTGIAKQPCGDEKDCPASGCLPACGIFQNKDGKNPNTDVPTCQNVPQGQECPEQDIQKMCQCGIQGCNNQGYANIQDCQNRYPGNYAAIARCYNTGSVPSLSDLTQTAGSGVKLYPQDIGNFLMGLTTDQVYNTCQQ
ncbi:MAG: hypothetical protein Q9227_008350 [Pyrenula ochraceoflavens]